MTNFRLSVSKSKCFNQCKKQYQFSYIFKFPKKTRDYHILGKFCHRTLELFHNAYISGTDQPYHLVMTASFRQATQEYQDQLTPEIKQDAKPLITDYLQKITRDNPTSKMPGNVIACEKKFELLISENVVLNGAIDIISLDDYNILNVADFKTTKNKKYLKDDWFQLLTYAYVLYLENPEIEKIKASYILLRHQSEYLTTEFTLDQIKEVPKMFLDYANQMQTETEFPATTSPLCNWCDYLEHCEQGRQKAMPQKIYGEVKW